MKTLVAVEGQTLRWYGKIPEIADNSVQFVQLEFSLPEDWADLVVVAQFSQTKTYNKLLENGCCYLPAELVAGPCEVSLFGQAAGETVRATSIPLRFKISRSGFTSTAETPIPPTPDLYSQLLEKLGHQGPSESVAIEDDGEGNVSFAPGFEGDGEDHELNSLNTGKTVYTSFPDKAAREGLKGKLDNPGGLTPGKLLRVKSVDQDGSILLEGVEMPSEGSSVVIDTTLTQPGQAADAKATGDAISKLSQQNLNPDTTLTKSGEAADAKATGDEIKRVEGLIPSIEGLAKTEDIPKVPNWAMQTSKPGYTASEVGADPKGTAASALAEHNTATDAHNDIRVKLEELRQTLAHFFDAMTPETMDQISELVSGIEANADLIAALTTRKVSVSSIVANLTTNLADRPLAASMGVELKNLIDQVSASLANYQPKGNYAPASAVPTKVSQLTNDKGYLTEHQDISGKLDADKLPQAVADALAQAKESGEFDGATGDPGRGIKSITRTSGNGAAGTVDTYTITYTDGTTSTITVQHGSNGAPGYTPKRKIDYWTPADQEAIVQQVIAALGTPVFGRVDEDCKITLTGELADGKTYTFAFADEDGGETVIGTYTKAAPPAYTNRLPLAINADGTLYNGGQGWKTNTRLNSSGAESTSSADGIEVTGFIPVKSGDKVYLENIAMNTGTKSDKTYMWLYDSSFAKLDGRYRLFSQYGSAFDTQKNQGLIATDENGNITMLTIDHDVFYTGSSHADLSKAAYLRISCEEINADSIITVNEPIV